MNVVLFCCFWDLMLYDSLMGYVIKMFVLVFGLCDFVLIVFVCEYIDDYVVMVRELVFDMVYGFVGKMVIYLGQIEVI